MGGCGEAAMCMYDKVKAIAEKAAPTEKDVCFARGFTASIKDDEELIGDLESKEMLSDAELKSMDTVRKKQTSTSLDAATKLFDFEKHLSEAQAEKVKKKEITVEESQKCVKRIAKTMACIKAIVGPMAAAAGTVPAIKEMELPKALEGMKDNLSEQEIDPPKINNLIEIAKLAEEKAEEEAAGELEALEEEHGELADEAMFEKDCHAGKEYMMEN